MQYFVIYRHPFHRLVSAFRDKLEHSHPPMEVHNDYYFKLHGEKIACKYRKLAERKFGRDFFSMKHNYGAPNAIKMGQRTERYPIFWEFVQFLLEGNIYADLHWIPQTRQCPPCSRHPFQYIFYFEESYQESFYLQDVLMQHRIKNPMNMNLEKFDIEFAKQQDQKMFQKSDSVTKLYFEQLTNEEIRALHKIYINDFRLLGYDFTFRNITYN